MDYVYAQMIWLFHQIEFNNEPYYSQWDNTIMIKKQYKMR